MIKNVYKMWEKRELPIINGIIYSNGKIELVEIEQAEGKKKARYNCSILLDDLYSNGEIDCSDVIVNSYIISPNNKYEIYCGEGSFGGDGFIVVISKNKNELEWIAFFEDSNPFMEVQADDEIICGITTLNEKWTFNILNPRNIKIEVI